MSVKESIPSNFTPGMSREIADAKEFQSDLSGRAESIAAPCGQPPRPGPCRPPEPSKCTQRCRIETIQKGK